MIDPAARALLDLIVQRGVPPAHTLTPDEARRAFLERRSFTQPAAARRGVRSGTDEWPGADAGVSAAGRGGRRARCRRWSTCTAAAG